jgi:hypothetical protein
MDRQHGTAGRDQYNVGRDLHKVTVKVGPGQLKEVLDGKDGTGGIPGKRAAAGGSGAVVVFVIIAVIAYAITSSHSTSNTPFPAKGGPWPRGATVAGVMAPVLSRLKTCARVAVLTPVNCPQSMPDSYGDATGIHWSLHGNPADGAKIVYLNNAFEVAGNAIMKVFYSGIDGNTVSVQTVHYRAQLRWRDGRASLMGIKGVSGAAGPLIRKHKPAITWDQVSKAVRSAFNYCAGSSSAPLPPQCPVDQYSGISGSHAHWRLTSDPLLNAQENFDPSSGLIHVTGSYSLSVTYSDILGRQHDSQNGNYEATVSVDGQTIEVLQIAAS